MVHFTDLKGWNPSTAFQLCNVTSKTIASHCCVGQYYIGGGTCTKRSSKVWPCSEKPSESGAIHTRRFAALSSCLHRVEPVSDRQRRQKWRPEKLSLWLDFSAGASHWQQMEKCHISVCIGCRVSVPVEIITHMWVARSHDTWNDYMTVLITVFDAVVFCIH